MESIPNDWLSLLALVFVLGLRHGFDPDHLATINGLTRHNLACRLPWSRYCGVLFSLGHGAVVVAVAVSIGALTRLWAVPGWMEDVGACVTVFFLVLLGSLNLHAVLAAGPEEVVHPVGVKGRLLSALQRTSNPLLIALVGALFALSFDTMSQAALFALTATQFGGWERGLAVGLVFTAGMMIADGANGLWTARLLARADQLALIASRMMGLAVAGISFLVAGLGAMKYLSPGVEGLTEGRELAVGAAVVAAMTLSYAAAARLARPA